MTTPYTYVQNLPKVPTASSLPLAGKIPHLPLSQCPYNIQPLIKGSADPREGLEGTTAPAMPQTWSHNQKEKSRPPAFGDEDYRGKMRTKHVYLQKGHRVDMDLD